MTRQICNYACMFLLLGPCYPCYFVLVIMLLLLLLDCRLVAFCNWQTDAIVLKLVISQEGEVG